MLSFSTGQIEKNSWENWGIQNWLFGGEISRPRYLPEMQYLFGILQILAEEFQHAQGLGQTIWEFVGNSMGILLEILGESFGEF